jgi:hypothetical protein
MRWLFREVTSLGNRAGAMQDLVPWRYRPSEGLDLNFFGGLSP